MPLIQEEFPHRTADLDSLLIQACRILADSSDNLGFVISPHIFRLPFEHLRFVKISDRRVLVILVTPFHMVLTETLEALHAPDPGRARPGRPGTSTRPSGAGPSSPSATPWSGSLPKYRVKYEDTLDKLLDLLKASIDRGQGREPDLPPGHGPAPRQGRTLGHGQAPGAIPEASRKRPPSSACSRTSSAWTGSRS
ncbi:MAG: hypothetical protein M0C28_49090 [Candidatus Moduliflexus flocculans]|nr:hypothetical protein [Candidatus Moduliflexus flocculans]